jgi:hypothetical protein
MKDRSRGYWIAGAFIWCLTSAALAQVATVPPGNAVTGNVPASHANKNRPADRSQRHAHGAQTAHQQAAAKPATKQPELNDGATLSQYQFAYGNANVPFSPPPEMDQHYKPGTAESEALARNSSHSGLPAASGTPGSAPEPDDTWRFKASPLMNATHAHEVGATVSFRHDF